MTAPQDLISRPSVDLPMGDTRRKWALGFLASAQFLIVLDASIVNIALPSMGHDLAIGQSLLTWVVTGYVLAFGGLLMLGGRLGDRYGHRRVFLTGVVGFMLASLLAALSSAVGVLLAARALQGVSAALLAPAALALLMKLFPVGDGRAQAVSVWGAVAGLGGVTGAVVGGLLTTKLGWQAIFLINIPVCLSVAVAVPILIEKDTERRLEPLDLPGALAITAAMVAVMAAFSFALEAGFLAWPTLGIAVAGVVMIWLFVTLERCSKHPLIALSIFTHRNVTVGNLVMLLVGGTTLGFFFILSLQMQLVFGLSAMQTGVLQLPLTLALLVTASLVPRVSAWISMRSVQTLSLALMAVGFFWIGLAPVGASFAVSVLGPLVLVGVGLGGAFISTTEMAVNGVSAAQSGLVSGLVNTSQQMGGALVLAVVVTLAVTRSRALQVEGIDPLAALNGGYAGAYVCLGFLCLLAATISLLGLGKDHAVAT